MALCPFATHRLLPENKYQPSITPYAAIWHSAVDAPGPSTLFHFFARTDVTLESHFFIKNSGEIEQYMDTNVRADANFRANGFWRSGKYVGAISVETEDDGDPDRRPWNAAQIASSIRLGKWIREVHPQIPATLCPEWNANGFGYHTLFPTMWTNVRGKTCPGKVRIPQFLNVILPAIAGNTQEEEEVMHELEILKAFDRWLGRLPSDTELKLHALYSKEHGAAQAWLNIANSDEAKAQRK